MLNEMEEITEIRRQLFDEENRFLRQRIAERDRELATLSDELAETNKRVVVLYAELDNTAHALRENAAHPKGGL